jgi:hypothetical protein
MTVIMKSLRQKKPCAPMSVDIAETSEQAPRRKTLILPKSVPLDADHKPLTSSKEQARRRRAKRPALERLQNRRKPVDAQHREHHYPHDFAKQYIPLTQKKKNKNNMYSSSLKRNFASDACEVLSNGNEILGFSGFPADWDHDLTAFVESAPSPSRARDFLFRFANGLHRQLEQSSAAYWQGDRGNLYNAPWSYTQLLATPDSLVGLLTIARQSKIPIHDHPGQWGVFRVLNGELHLRQVDRGRALDHAFTTFRLTMHGEQSLLRGNCAWLGPDHGNLHQLAAGVESVTILNVRTGSTVSEKQSIYVPWGTDPRRGESFRKIARRNPCSQSVTDP